MIQDLENQYNLQKRKMTNFEKVIHGIKSKYCHEVDRLIQVEEDQLKVKVDFIFNKKCVARRTIF
jgi:hypothetical protein